MNAAVVVYLAGVTAGSVGFGLTSQVIQRVNAPQKLRSSFRRNA